MVFDDAEVAPPATAARVLSPEEETVVRRCGEVMDEVLAQGDGLFVCDVPPGADLHGAVEAALAEAGRAFGAAAAFQAVKAGDYHADRHSSALRAFPFRRWSRGERLLAPPLVVAVDGADHASIWAVQRSGGRPRLLVRFDDPTREWHRFGFGQSHGRWYAMNRACHSGRNFSLNACSPR